MREREMLGRAIEGAAAVIACGGGTVLDEGARASLQRRCRTVWLEVSPAEAARRLRGAESVRPLLAGGTPEERLARLLEERAPLYLVASCCRIATDGRTADEVAGAVLAALAGAVQP
jgi:shikimate kinase